MILKKAKTAFTLAEVLITLLIIGVVASLVIPALINNTNEAEYNTGLKKIMADLSGAVKMLEANNGEIAVGTSTTTNITFRDDFCNVMSCIEKGSSANIFNNQAYKGYKSSNDAYWMNSKTYTAAKLSNGTLLQFVNATICTANGVNACGLIIVDINGFKGPNMAGKDYFEFHVVRKDGTGAYSILPVGTDGDLIGGPTGMHPCAIGEGLGCTYTRLYTPEKLLQ